MNIVKEVQKQLMRLFAIFLAGALVMVVAFETHLIPEGVCSAYQSTEFICAVVMELFSICIIPLALKLFKFKSVEKHLSKPVGLLKWGTLRICMLGIPLWINVVCYGLFLNAAFGYLAIILFLCMFFIVPTLRRCRDELKGDGMQQSQKTS